MNTTCIFEFTREELGDLRKWARTPSLVLGIGHDSAEVQAAKLLARELKRFDENGPAIREKEGNV